MRVCIPSPFPGGPETGVTARFELADMLDYYEIRPGGTYEQVAQTRNCAGGCSDPVERISRRQVDLLIVTGISQSYLNRFRRAGVKVLRAKSQSVDDLLRAAAANNLEEMKKGDT